MNNLKIFMIENKIKNMDLAKASGVHYTTLSRINNLAQVPTDQHEEKIMKGLLKLGYGITGKSNREYLFSEA